MQDQQNRYEARLQEAQLQDESEYHTERLDMLAQIFAALSSRTAVSKAEKAGFKNDNRVFVAFSFDAESR